MIKLAVSDLDGCLLDSRGCLPAGFSALLCQMEQQGCLFAAASGRSQPGTRKPFQADASRIALISDNGSCVYYQQRCLFLQTPDQEMLKQALRKCLSVPGVIPVLCAVQNAYIPVGIPVDQQAEEELDKYYFHWQRLADPQTFPEPIIKLSLLYFDDIEKNVYPLVKCFDGPLAVRVTAFVWIDIFDVSVSKGTGVHELQKALHISPAETIVFGDYLNDIPMAAFASRSFAPANAHPDVLAAYTDHIAANTEGSVAHTIANLLQQQKQKQANSAA